MSVRNGGSHETHMAVALSAATVTATMAVAMDDASAARRSGAFAAASMLATSIVGLLQCIVPA